MKIDGWQIVQTGSMEMEVRLCGTGSLVCQYEKEIAAILRHHLGDSVKLNIKQVERLMLTNGGKLKPVWIESNQQDAAGHEVKGTMKKGGR